MAIYEFHNSTTGPPDPRLLQMPDSCKHAASHPAQVRVSARTRDGSAVSPLPPTAWSVQAARDPHVAVYKASGHPLPSVVDSSALSPGARDQSACGGCWAFSAAAVAEVVLAKAASDAGASDERGVGYASWLSPQSLLDCVPRVRGTFENATVICNNGCFGNVCVDQPGEFIVAHGIATEASYPFRAVVGASCAMGEANVVRPLAKTMRIAPGADAEEQMRAAVAEHGAVRAVLKVTPSLEFYSVTPDATIFDDATCDAEPNHAVAIVGYGTQDGADYWLVKNSFGPTWGQAGFFRLARGKNMCGIGNWSSVFVANATEAARMRSRRVAADPGKSLV